MAITAIGSLGSSNDKSTGRECTLSPSRDVPAGRLLVIWYANDSIYNVGIDTDAGNFFRAKDTQGNIWCTIADVVDKRCFFRCGALAQLYACQLRYPLSTGDVITVEAGNHDPGNVWAKAMSVEEFDLGNRMRWCLPHEGPTKGYHVASDPPGASYSVLGETKDILFLHCLGVEGPNTDTYTWDPNYTEIAGDGTTGGADDDNIHVRGGYRIKQDTTGDSLSITSDTADRDSATVMTGIFATRRRRAFPTTPILDDFNRAGPENPIDNGIWNTSRDAFYGGMLALATNDAGAQAGGSWLLDDWTNCGEAYMTITDFDASYQGGHGVHFFGRGRSTDGTMFSCGTSWALTYGMMHTVIFFGVSDIHGAAKISGAGGETGLSVILGHWPGQDGYKLGIQRLKDRAVMDPDLGFVDHLWIDKGDGWEEVAACIRQYGTFIPRTGEAAFSCHTSLGHVDDIGGGQIRCPAPYPQIYRRPNE